MKGTRRLVAAVVAVVAALLLTACGGTADVDGAGTVTSLGGADPVRTLDAAQVDAAVAPQKPRFVTAVKAFRACDRKVSGGRAGPYACLKKVQAETAVVNAMSTALAGTVVPPASEATVDAVNRLAAAGRLVRNKCSKVSDQVCDQALARFRAQEQSLVWELKVTV